MAGIWWNRTTHRQVVGGEKDGDEEEEREKGGEERVQGEGEKKGDTDRQAGK